MVLTVNTVSHNRAQSSSDNIPAQLPITITWTLSSGGEGVHDREVNGDEYGTLVVCGVRQDTSRASPVTL